MKRILFLLIGSLFVLFSSCGPDLPNGEKIPGAPYELVNQDSSTVLFPDAFKGNIIFAGFIFTHCPDICPMTTHNMHFIKERLAKEGIKDVKLAAISFDPARDTPPVLKQYAEVREYNLNDFSFFTGPKGTIDSLMSSVNFAAFTDDTTYTDDGEPVYYFTHNDRILLIDRNGKIRKTYKGSHVDLEEITEDVKRLED